MGSAWSERYLTPTEIFFETLKNEWSKLKMNENQDEVLSCDLFQTLKVFIKHVRENFMGIWESNIVKNMESIGGSRKSSALSENC